MAPDDQRDVSMRPRQGLARAALRYGASVACRWAGIAFRRLRADRELDFVVLVGGFVLTLLVIEEVLIARDVPPRVVAVDSVPQEDSYPLAQWNLDKAAAGYVEGITVGGARLDPAAATTLGDGDTISLRGWAGDTDLGARFSRVVFSLCDRIVGAAAVALPRPDVARQVHPNLSASGWAAQLLVGHLPRCDGARLAAWAVAPFGRTLYPLQGAISLALAPVNGADAHVIATTTTLLRPADVDEAGRKIVVEIKTGPVNLRRCGAVSCAVVGTLGRGTHPGLRLDGNDEWALVLIPDVTTGWISLDAARVAPTN
jgi:hypothetical protein